MDGWMGGCRFGSKRGRGEGNRVQVSVLPVVTGRDHSAN